MPVFVGGLPYVPLWSRFNGKAGAEMWGSGMPFRIEFVEDKDLPGNVDWAIARDDRGRMFFVKRSKVCPKVLAEAWAASVQLSDSRSG